MKVAIFTDTFMPQINGVTNTLGRMMHWLPENGVSAMVFAPQYGQDDPISPNVERFPSIRFFLYPECRLAVPAAHRIHASLDAFRPDLVFDMTEFNMGRAGLAVAQRLGVPAVSNYSTHFPQYLEYYRADWLKPTVWKYIRQFHNHHALTLCPSRDAQKRLGQQGIEKTAIFSRGIDTERFHPAKRSEALREALGVANRLTALYVGRLSAEKDLDVLRDAWHAVKARFGDRVRLVVAGDGPMAGQYRRDFPEGTIFTGFQRGEALSVLYASCDLFVFPSATETFGNVILEAMASGLPVLGAAAGGVGEIIRHGHDGLVFPARSKAHLFSQLSDLIENPLIRRHYAANGLATAASRTWDHEFGILMAHFQKLAGQTECDLNLISGHAKPDDCAQAS